MKWCLLLLISIFLSACAISRDAIEPPPMSKHPLSGKVMPGNSPELDIKTYTIENLRDV